MKKIVLALLICTAINNILCQTVSDTIYCRSDKLYYSEWYDTTRMFYDTIPSHGPCCLQSENFPISSIPYVAVSDYTPRPLEVRGLAAMVLPRTFYYIDCGRLGNSGNVYMWDTASMVNPEYLYLYQQIGDSLVMLESVRWDTATPQVLVLPKHHDTAAYGFEYCSLYTALFKEPITVDSIFWIGGSYNNNTLDINYVYQHRPIFYASFGRQGFNSVRPKYHSENQSIGDENGPWYNPHFNPYYGPYFAVAPDTSVLLEARSDDAEMGSVTGGGYYLDSSYRVIEAHPRSGHKFTHWNDGDRTNPRTVLLTHDTSFTAYFAPLESFRASGIANDGQRGHVDGGGAYLEGDTVTLTAVAHEHYGFIRWSDGNTANPRQFVITCDTVFKATFYHLAGIDTPQEGAAAFALMPNPATGTVRCMVPEEGFAAGTLTLHDAAGKEVLRQKIARPGTHDIDISALPAGVYFATLTTAQGSSTLRLVVE